MVNIIDRVRSAYYDFPANLLQTMRTRVALVDGLLDLYLFRV